MLSYAQNGEDVVLNRVFADRSAGFYVDIGACHPVEDSVTLHFYERGWHGVNVEPDHELIAAFLLTRSRDTNLHAAIGRTRGRIAFYPTGTRGHGTLDTAMAADRSAGRMAEPVPMVLLSDVIDCYVPSGCEIDFLKIDVEGWESEVIASGDWARHRPRVLVIEAVDDKGHPSHVAWEQNLLDAGYRYAMFDGLNQFYCRNEDADELMSRLAAPANVRDNWVRAGDNAAHESIARLNAEFAAASQRTAAAEARAEALGADLEMVRGEAINRIESAEEQMEQLRVDSVSAAARSDALNVVVARARSEAAAALHREEAAEASLVALETEAARLRVETAAALRHVERVAALEDELSKRNADARALRDSHDQLARQTTHLNATVAALHTSTSWKLSRPVRIVGRLLRGAGG